MSEVDKKATSAFLKAVIVVVLGNAAMTLMGTLWGADLGFVGSTSGSGATRLILSLVLVFVLSLIFYFYQEKTQ